MLEYGQARPEEEEDLIDFANYVFSMDGSPTDYKILHPRVYGRPGFSGITQVARENGKIKGLISAVTGALRAGEHTLKYGYIGTVSTHPYARGRGIMKRLMPQTMDILKKQGCEFIALGGQRQRYQHFGFEDAGTKLSMNITMNSLCHVIGKTEHEKYTFTPLNEEGKQAADLAFSLYSAGSFVCERTREDFLAVLRTWGGIAYSVLQENQPAGYFYLNSNRAAEFRFTQDADAPAIFSAFLAQQKMDRIQIAVRPFELNRFAGLFAAADSWELVPSCMIRVLDWQAFLSALLQFKASLEPLQEGERTLEIIEEGRFSICVKAGSATVERTDSRPDFSLDSLAAVRLVCPPLSKDLYANHPFLNWFPLPFDLPEADAF